MSRILSLASGRGSNFSAVVRAINEGKIKDGNLVGLITDRPDTGAADIAEQEGIPVKVIDCSIYKEREEFDYTFEKTINSFDPELILALGYMRIINRKIVEKYSCRIINIHPSLLPAFPGINSQKQAFEYGVRVTGATVHYIDSKVDTGPIILQRSVEVLPEMTLEGLAKKILKEEHEIIVEAVDLHCSGLLNVAGRKVKIIKE